MKLPVSSTVFSLLLIASHAPLAAQSNTDPPPFLRTGPNLTPPPAACPDFVKTRWMDRDGDGWDDLWVYMNRIAHRDHATDTDGDTVSDYDEMLRWRDPHVKGPPLGWPFLTVQEILEAQIAAEALRLQNEARMAQRRAELRRFAAGPVTAGVHGRALSMAEVREKRMARFREKWQAGKIQRDQALLRARATLQRSRVPEIIQGPDGNAAVFSGADHDGTPRFHIAHNLISAKTIQRDRVTLPVAQGGLGLAFTGAGVVLGHWDVADAEFAHQDLGTLRVSDEDVTTAPINANAASRRHATHTAGTMIGLGLSPAVGSHLAGDSVGMAGGALLKSWDSQNDVADMDMHYAHVPASSQVLVSNHSYGTPCGWDGNAGGIPTWYGGVANYPVDPKLGSYNNAADQLDEHVAAVVYHLPVYSAGNHRDQGPQPSLIAAGLQYLMVDPVNGNQLIRFRESMTDPNVMDWYDENDIAYQPPPVDGDFSNGYSTLSPEATAKSVLSVGSCADLPTGYAGPASVAVSSFSSWGGGNGDRLKPDVVANGEALLSAIYDGGGTGSYAEATGTSMASPSVAGALALLVEQYRSYYGAGARLWASTLKGLIIHTADDLGAPGPDPKTGWGLVNVRSAAELLRLDAILGAQGAPRHRRLKEIMTFVQTAPAQPANEITIPVRADGGPLKVTVCWTDPWLPGWEGLVFNHFDLRVEPPAGPAHHPWAFDNGMTEPAVRDNPGSINNDVVKQVLIDNAVAGQVYEIKLGCCCFHLPSPNEGPYAPVSLLISGGEQVVEELKITMVELAGAGGQVAFGWPSSPGEVYRVETSTDLMSWTRAKDATGDDYPDLLPQGVFSTAEGFPQPAGESRRFWRVRLLQPWDDIP